MDKLIQSPKLKSTLRTQILVGLALASCGIGAVLAAVPNDTLVILLGAENSFILDPALAYDADSSGVIENVYESLVTYKGTSLKELAPLLSTGWTIAKDKKTYTFSLRSNVKFHSGNIMTCADAEYSYRRLLVTNNSASAVWFIAGALLGTSSNATDDASVTWEKISNAVSCNAKGQLVFQLNQPTPAFVAMTAYTVGSILEKKFSVDHAEWSGTSSDWKAWVGKDLNESAYSKIENVNGTGAYQINSVKPDVALFTSFKDYWGGTPKIAKVLYQKVDTEDGRILALKKGDGDIGGVRRVLLDQLKVPNVKLIDDLPNLATDYVVMNFNIKSKDELGSGKLDGNGIPANFFSDIHVRKCFAGVYDVNTIIKDLLLGKGKARSMALPEGFLGYDPTIKTVPFNLELAKKECKLAWNGEVWKNGFEVKGDYFGARVPTTFQLMQTNLAKLNPKFKLDVQRIQSSEFANLQEGKGSLFISGWLPDYLDSDNYLYANYHSNGYNNSFSGFSDKKIDDLIEKARGTSSVKARETFYKQVGRRAAELVANIPIAEGVNYFTINANLKGFEENYNPMHSGSVLWKVLSK